MTRYVQFLYRWRRLLAAGAAVVVAAGALLAAQLRVETDWTRLFPYPTGAFRDSLRLLDRFGRANGLMFLFSDASGGPVLDRLDAVAPLVARLEHAGLFERVIASPESEAGGLPPDLAALFLDPDGVSAAASRLTPAGVEAQVAENVRLLFTPAGGLLAPALRRDPLQIGRLVATGGAGRAGYALREGYVVSTDGRSLLVLAVPPSDDAHAADWLARLAALTADLRARAAAAGLVCRMPGSAFLRAELFESVRRDLRRATLVSLLGVVLVFAFAYRGSWRRILCVLLPVLASLAVTFGLYRLHAGTIDLISAMSAAMLVGLGVDFGIHLLARYEEEAGTATPPERAAVALGTTGRGVASGALTTAVAFFSILITGMRSFYVLGIIAGVGILVALASAFFVLPLCLFLLGPFRRTVPAGPPAPGRAFGRVRAAVPALLVALAVLTPFAARLRFESDFRMFLPRHSRALADLQAAEALGGGAADGLILQLPSRGYRTDARAAAAIEAVADPRARWKSPFRLLPGAAEREAAVARFAAERTARGLSPEATRRALAAALAEHGLRDGPEYDAYVAGLYDALEDRVDEDRLYALPMVRPFLSDDGAALYLVGVYPDGRAWTAAKARRLTKAAAAAGAPARAVSGALLMERIRARVVPDSLKAAAAGVLLIFVVLRVHLRRTATALLVFLPLASALALTAGVMGLLGLSINYFNLTVLPLIFGLGIDDGVHFMEAARETGSAERALARVARPMFLTTLTTCIGFGSLGLVSFRGVQLMGGFIALGLAACLLCTLVLLPAAITARGRVSAAGEP